MAGVGLADVEFIAATARPFKRWILANAFNEEKNRKSSQSFDWQRHESSAMSSGHENLFSSR